MYIFYLPLTNAIEALKSEFLADPGIIRPEFEFIPNLSCFKYKILFISLKINFWCHKQEFLISWTWIE